MFQLNFHFKHECILICVIFVLPCFVLILSLQNINFMIKPTQYKNISLHTQSPRRTHRYKV